MKNFTDQNKKQKLLRLVEVREQLRALEKEEKDLRSEVIAMLDGDKSAQCFGLVILLKDRSRESLDKELLTASMGKDFVKKYTKTSTYQVLEVN